MVATLVARRNPFSPKIITEIAKFQQISSGFLVALQPLHPRQLLSIYAVLSILLRNIFTDMGVLTLDANEKWQIDEQKLPLILQNLQSVTTAFTYLSQHIQEFWKDGKLKPYHNKDSIRGYLTLVEELGLLKFDKVPPGYMAQPDPVTRKPTSPCARFYDVDVIGCLILLHTIHEILVGYGEAEGMENPLDVFPSHRGYLTVFLYNAVLGCIQKWGRTEPDAGWKIEVPPMISRFLANTYRRLEQLIKRSPFCTQFGWLRQTIAEAFLPNLPEPAS